MLENVRERGEQLRAGLGELKLKYPDTVAGTLSVVVAVVLKPR